MRADSPIVATLAQLALFAVLFTDGMRVGWADPALGVAAAGARPGVRAAADPGGDGAGRAVRRRPRLGGVPADRHDPRPDRPGLRVRAIGNDKVPARLRHLLNVESGVNDGLALPFVIVFLAVAAGSDDLHLGELALEVSLGMVVGVAIPAAAILLERTRLFAASTVYEPLNGVAIGLLVLAVASSAG